MAPRTPIRKTSRKVATGIAGFDEITNGGLPRDRTTLLAGGPGSGKTLFALQFLVHGAQHCGEPGIFVAFEERSERVIDNADGFGWKLAELTRNKLCFVDAQPIPDLVQFGAFDLLGLLAALEALTQKTGARRIVFDALDVVLSLLPGEASQRSELYRLHEWMVDKGITGLITAKAGSDGAGARGRQPFGLLQFMVDCAVVLNHGVLLGISQRTVRVLKYRGSGFDENESPFLIGSTGIDVAMARPLRVAGAHASKERVSSGVKRLDTMLGGGYYRGACVLATGLPGTAKTTLSGAFAEAACVRGEQTLFVSFDADASEVVRDLASVGIRLAPHLKRGLLTMISARSVTGSAETYLVNIKRMAQAQGARCLVIDPISTWSRFSDGLSAHNVTERLIDWSKAAGITLMCTSLPDEIPHRTVRGASPQISTLADTWIHLDYLVQAGERNRGLSIIKSRGTSHSNQVRELVLSDAGVTLADIYTAGGEVLMGTLRWEKESAEQAASDQSALASQSKRLRLDAEEAELQARVQALQMALAAKKAEKALLQRTAQSRARSATRGDSRVRALRRADVAKDKPPTSDL